MFNLPRSKPKVQGEFLKSEFHLPFQSSNLKFCIRMTSHEKFKIIGTIIYIKNRYNSLLYEEIWPDNVNFLYMISTNFHCILIHSLFIQAEKINNVLRPYQIFKAERIIIPCRHMVVF